MLVPSLLAKATTALGLQTFRVASPPVLAYFARHGLLHEVDANDTVAVVYEHVRDACQACVSRQ